METKNKSKIYEPLDFFMLRTPIFPTSFYHEVNNAFRTETNKISQDNLDQLIAYFETPEVSDSIYIASKSLYESIKRLNQEKDTKKLNQIILNLIKYLIRMSTRPTPFGLFSGVTVGKFSDNTDISLSSIDLHKKHIRPDMLWLMGLVKDMESNEDIVMQLQVKVNSMIDIAGNRVNIPYNPRYGVKTEEGKFKDMTNVSFRLTPPVSFVMENANKFILYKDLLDLLHSQYSDYPKETIKNFLWELFNNECLISELRPPLMIDSQFNYINNKLSKFKEIDPRLNILDNIDKGLTDYSNSKYGDGNSILNELFDNMKKVKDSSSFVQVDTTLTHTSCHINKDILDEASSVADFLWMIAPTKTSSPHLEEYRYAFIEKYGVYREVPVLELLDPDRGLGSPAGYNFPPSNRELKNQSLNNTFDKLENYILNKMVTPSNKFLKEIDLTDDIIKNLEIESPKIENAPDSMELYLLINTESKDAFEKGEYEFIIGPNPGSDGAGKTFGRFLYYFDEETQDNIKKINNYEKELYDDSIIAEIVYIPNSERAANVCITKNIRDYELSIATNSSKDDEYSLSVNDILVGATYNGLYLKSKKHNKRVILKTGHMLNIMSAPNIYRFLFEVSKDEKKGWTIPYFKTLDTLPYCPRIKYGKTVILPTTWNFNKEILNIKPDDKKISFDDFVTKVEKWKKDWQVANMVFWVESDNRILLDLSNRLHLEMIWTDLTSTKTEKQFKFIESIQNSNLISHNDDNFIGEIVIPFVKTKNHDEKDIKQEQPKHFISEDTRTKFPGSEWLYFKLYGNSSREDELIAYDLFNICQDIIANGYADKYFFMRYSDSEKHIRLRFNGNPEILCSKLLPYINKEFLNLNNNKLLSKFQIDTYEREVERYGGEDLIDLAEQIFYYDSIIVQEILQMKKNKLLSLDFNTVIILSILDYLDSFSLNTEEQFELLNDQVNYKDYLDDFRKSRKELTFYCNKLDNWSNLRSTEFGECLYNIFSKRHAIIKTFSEKMNLIEKNGMLTNSTKDIIGSFIHLHCNRILGIDRIYESKLMTLSRHTLHSLKYVYKNSSNKSK